MLFFAIEHKTVQKIILTIRIGFLIVYATLSNLRG